MALGLLIPCLIGFSVMKANPRRAAFALAVLVAGLLVTGLSAALSWGPSHAWAWLSLPVQVGLLLGAILAASLVLLPPRACAAIALIALMLHLSFLNQASESAYFTHTLQAWEQGRFIHFNGLAQWLGWLWPYLALAYVLARVSRADAPPKIGT